MAVNTRARRAGIYVRISQDSEQLGLGVQRQEEDCRTLAEQLGWSVIDVFSDNDISAYRGKPRPGYRALLADVEAGRIDAIIAWHTDRMHRRPIELEEFIEIAERKAIDIRTVRAGHLDLSTAAGRMIARQLGVAARYESEMKSERLTRRFAQKAARGEHKGGRRCYGWEPDGLTIRESEANEIRGMYEQVLAGASLRSIVDDLNRRGVSTTTGSRPWASVTVRKLLLSPRQTGLREYRGEVIGEAVWPPIVDRVAWEAARSILAAPGRKTNHRGGEVRWLGSGIYVCGVCGSTDVRMSMVEGRRRYRCRNRVKGDPKPHVGRDQKLLDEYVARVICERFGRADARDFLSAPTPTVDAGALRAEDVELRGRQKALVRLFTAGQLTEEQLAEGTAEIEARRDEIARVLAPTAVPGPLAELAGAADEKEARVVWDGLTLGVQREVLRTSVRITLLPTRPGRKPGPAGPGAYFDYAAVSFDWMEVAGDGGR